MKQTSKNTTKTGNLGESVASQYLKKRGFLVIERNYWRKWGEIDIVCQRAGRVHFVEVKTLAYKDLSSLEWAITHETWRPEDQVHARKLRQIEKALETWLSENQWQEEWQIDVLAVRIVESANYATINRLENVTEAG